ncbi:uncharacterized protein LOC114814533 [Ornithorhynchus anatinus]|uniref:uncharacterized protein LOC114814533 n=1 Tax=Ornithorhynchus anatinus TaxID=9258 RepID=UPI0010A89FAA|nr:uncharacterized protein LOC114814533 [Ornithorhynchus anatinus]
MVNPIYPLTELLIWVSVFLLLLRLLGRTLFQKRQSSRYESKTSRRESKTRKDESYLSGHQRSRERHGPRRGWRPSPGRDDDNLQEVLSPLRRLGWRLKENIQRRLLCDDRLACGSCAHLAQRLRHVFSEENLSILGLPSTPSYGEETVSCASSSHSALRSDTSRHGGTTEESNVSTHFLSSASSLSSFSSTCSSLSSGSSFSWAATRPPSRVSSEQEVTSRGQRRIRFGQKRAVAFPHSSGLVKTKGWEKGSQKREFEELPAPGGRDREGRFSSEGHEDSAAFREVPGLLVKVKQKLELHLQKMLIRQQRGLPEAILRSRRQLGPEEEDREVEEGGFRLSLALEENRVFPPEASGPWAPNIDTTPILPEASPVPSVLKEPTEPPGEPGGPRSSLSVLGELPSQVQMSQDSTPVSVLPPSALPGQATLPPPGVYEYRPEPPSELPFISTEMQWQLEQHITRLRARQKWGLPRRVQESFNLFLQAQARASHHLRDPDPAEERSGTGAEGTSPQEQVPLTALRVEAAPEYRGHRWQQEKRWDGVTGRPTVEWVKSERRELSRGRTEEGKTRLPLRPSDIWERCGHSVTDLEDPIAVLEGNLRHKYLAFLLGLPVPLPFRAYRPAP